MKKGLSLSILWMILLLTASCTLETSTTSSLSTVSTATTVFSTTSTHASIVTTPPPVLYSSVEAADLIRQSIERIHAIALNGEDESSNEVLVTNQTFLRTELIESLYSPAPGFLLETSEIMAALLPLLESCVDDVQSGRCEHRTDGLDQQLKWSLHDGFVRFDYRSVQTQYLGFSTRITKTYHAIELTLSPTLELRHLYVGPTDLELATSKRIRYVSFVEGGDFESIDQSPSELVLYRHDASAGLTIQTVLFENDRMYVARTNHSEALTHLGVFDSQGTLISQTVLFGADRNHLTWMMNVVTPHLVFMTWDAFSVAGWDQVRFNSLNKPKLYQGDQPFSNDLWIDGSILDGKTFLQIAMFVPKDSLDAEALSLSPYGLLFEAVTFEELQAAVGVVPAQGLEWAQAEGFAFDREIVGAMLTLRIALVLDEAWLDSMTAK